MQTGRSVLLLPSNGNPSLERGDLVVAVAILSHGDFGYGLLGVVEMMLGPQDNVTVIPLHPSDNIESFQQTAGKIINQLHTDEGLLLLADILGGTPANTAARLVSQGRGTLITGVNVPMLLEIFSARQTEPEDSLARKAKEWALQGIQVLRPASFPHTAEQGRKLC